MGKVVRNLLKSVDHLALYKPIYNVIKRSCQFTTMSPIVDNLDLFGCSLK